jgi:hypothetical protein
MRKVNREGGNDANKRLANRLNIQTTHSSDIFCDNYYPLPS